MNIFVISFMFSICIIKEIACSCNWGKWTSSLQCEWVDNHCLKGYNRSCMCDSKVSMGLACNSNVMTNFIQTKPFVSNFYSNKGICYKSHCPQFSNWCQWDSWSHWSPITNITCNRLRSRKCCLAQPQIGYISAKPINYGCFITKSEQNSTQVEEEISYKQCSHYTWWLTKAVYCGIALSVIIIIIIICRCTGSKSTDKLKFSKKKVEFLADAMVVHYEPTAPPTTSNIEHNNSPLINDTNYPFTPPTYDETIRASFAETENENRLNGFNEKKNFPDFEENTSIMIEANHDINIDNIPPPSYTIYSRNPALFHPSS